MTARPRIAPRRWLTAVLLASGACAPARRVATAPTPAPPPPNTADLPIASADQAQRLLVDVRQLDSTIRVDLRYRGNSNFTGAPLPGYEGNRALLRREPAAALARVQRALRPAGLTLLLLDAYRPVRATEAMVRWTERTGRTSLLRDGYIASRSRHNLGVAVDLTLVDAATGRELAMGTEFDTFSSAAHTANARGEVLANRLRLRQAMEREGFVPYDQEWWHFSYPLDSPLRFDVVVR
jgi:D-alanyl-D-alanine dipeptidase